MSFASSMGATLSALDASYANANREADRQRTTDLNNHRAGYDLVGGKLVANEYGKQDEANRLAQARALKQDIALKSKEIANKSMVADAETEAIKAQLAQTWEKQKQTESIANAKSMNDALKLMYQGKANDAKLILQQNPVLMGVLKDQGITDLAAVDWVNDRALFTGIKGLQIPSPEYLKTGDMTALNSMFAKVQMKDGNWKIVNTEVLMKDANIERYMPTHEREWLANRSAKLHGILKGKYILSDEDIKKQTEYEKLKKQFGTTGANTIMKDKLQKEQLSELPSEVLDKVAKLYEVDTANVTLDMTKGYFNYIAKEKAKIAKTEAVEKHDEKQATEAGNLYRGYLKSTKALTDRELVILKQDQESKTKRHTSEVTRISKDISSNLSIADKANKVLESASRIQKGSKLLDTTVKVVQDRVGLAIGKENTEKVRTIIETDTRVGLLLQEFIKYMSGTAVTEEERKIYTDIITGRLVGYDGLITRIKTFKDTKLETAKFGITEAEDRGWYYTAYTQRKQYDRMTIAKKKPIGLGTLPEPGTHKTKGTLTRSPLDVSKYIKGKTK